MSAVELYVLECDYSEKQDTLFQVQKSSHVFFVHKYFVGCRFYYETVYSLVLVVHGERRSVNSTVEPTPAESHTAGKRRDKVCHFGEKVYSTKFAKCDYCPERKQPSHPNCSEASTPWKNWLAVPNIPEGYAVIKMHTTSRSKINPNRPGVDINEKRYWPVKIKHRSTGHTKWVNLHGDVPTTVRTFV